MPLARCIFERLAAPRARLTAKAKKIVEELRTTVRERDRTIAILHDEIERPTAVCD
ncbi:hypothetical protein [Mycobacterium avium]|uniref:Uncharacterized protein n=1 Tax=Mycobacterium avium subsp. hominissuis TaxID=439334 RepID=A0AAI8X1P1_MYCAV|nr:hypothetical protein [Mycobacterium avium]BBN46922.1 hypothetical protein JPH1_13970 [Mycobacterium avium subsp. hominissuis]